MSYITKLTRGLLHAGGRYSRRRRHERYDDERQEPETDDAGRARPRPGDARAQAPLAPVRDEPDDGRRLRRRALGALWRLRARWSRRTAADVYAAAVHRSDTEGVARPGARNGSAGRDRDGSVRNRTGLIPPPSQMRRSPRSASSLGIGWRW